MSRCYLAMIVLLASSSAHGKSLADAHHDMRVNLGLFSAVGYFGYTYSYTPVPVFELESGLGWGYSGVQLSMMPKLSFGSDRHRFVVGAGVSSGLDPENRLASWWLNAEVGLLLRSASRFSLLIAGGVTVGLAGEKERYCLVMRCRADQLRHRRPWCRRSAAARCGWL